MGLVLSRGLNVEAFLKMYAVGRNWHPLKTRPLYGLPVIRGI
jgi:hypothetical protein